MLEERRQFERFDVGFNANLEFLSGRNKVTEPTDLINLSAGGALLRCSADIECGTEVEINFSTPVHFVGSFLGSKADDAETNVLFRSTGIVLRHQTGESASSDPLMAVRFNGPLRISPKSESEV